MLKKKTSFIEPVQKSSIRRQSKFQKVQKPSHVNLKPTVVKVKKPPQPVLKPNVVHVQKPPPVNIKSTIVNVQKTPPSIHKQTVVKSPSVSHKIVSVPKSPVSRKKVVTVQKSSSIVSVPRRASIVSVPRKASIVSVPRKASIVSVPRKASFLRVPRKTSIVSVPRKASIVNVKKTPSIVSIKKTPSFIHIPTRTLKRKVSVGNIKLQYSNEYDIPLDPMKCYATGRGLTEATAMRKAIIVLHARNALGAPWDFPLQSLQCELVSMVTDEVTGCLLEQSESDQHTISFEPHVKGMHLLRVKLKGQHIMGSPFSVAVGYPVIPIGTPMLMFRDIKTPRGIAVNVERDEVIVAEMNAHCISIFSPSGEKIRSFGSYGASYGNFKYPRSVALDGEGNILVVDTKNSRIQKFTEDGRFITAVGTKGKEVLQFSDVKGIAYNPANEKVYITDKRRVQVLNSDLSFHNLFLKKGKRYFQNPWGIACNSGGDVYVADSQANEIDVFTSEGAYLRKIDCHGKKRSRLKQPANIAIDRNDIVFVSEHQSNSISVFTAEDQFLKSFGKKGKEAGSFRSPRGLAVDNYGIVYVCDMDNNRIQLIG